MTPSATVQLPEAATGHVPSACDDLLGFVLGAPRDEVPPRLVEAAVQNVLRALVTGFLHEPPLGHWYRHAFVVDGRPLSYHELLARLLPRVDGLTENERALFTRQPGAERLGDWVSSLYRLCARVLPPAAAPEVEAPASQACLGCPLPRAVRKIAESFRGRSGLRLFLHGSLATCDTTEYSDVDVLLIVSHEWLETGERALELRRIVRSAQRWLYRYDPLQHHGFMLVTELDLGRYARFYFPLELLSYAYSLSDGAPVRYRLRESDEESVSLLRRLCARLNRGEISVPATRYALKAALSEMMLLPTYYLQVMGRVMYKRDSYGAVRHAISTPALDAMDALSKWRDEWRRAVLEYSYQVIGGALPEQLDRRVLARVRSAPLSVRDRERWVSIVPGVQLLASELLGSAASVG